MRSNWSESFQKLLREYAESLVFAILAALLIRSFVLSPYAITTNTMVPTLQPGDLLLAYRLPFGVKLGHWTLGGRAPTVGEVVAFRCPGESGRHCVKRVAGVPGDRVEIKEDGVWLNGRLRTHASAIPTFGPIVVPPDTFFVLNDDLISFTDSRQFGAVPLESVEGRVDVIWLSLDWQKPGFLPEIRWPRVLSKIR
jgi:signal peptidase I